MINHQITDWVQGTGRRLGLYITRLENTLPRKRQTLLHQQRVDLVLDIGANAGQYADDLRQNGYRGSIASFEPIGRVFRELQTRHQADGCWQGRQMALGDSDGASQINVSQNLVSSSLLEVTPTSVSAVGATAMETTETIQVRRLDTLRPELMPPAARAYMKVDVQGFERQVLQGAVASLAQVVAIEVELSLVELYAGQALMPEMMQLLAGLGYRPVWLERGFKDPNSGYLLQMDGIFLRAAAPG